MLLKEAIPYRDDHEWISMVCSQSKIHLNGRTQGFPAEHCSKHPAASSGSPSVCSGSCFFFFCYIPRYMCHTQFLHNLNHTVVAPCHRSFSILTSQPLWCKMKMINQTQLPFVCWWQTGLCVCSTYCNSVCVFWHMSLNRECAYSENTSIGAYLLVTEQPSLYICINEPWLPMTLWPSRPFHPQITFDYFKAGTSHARWRCSDPCWAPLKLLTQQL